MFICKAVERGDAVASLSETNAVRWAYRQVGLPNYQRVSTLVQCVSTLAPVEYFLKRHFYPCMNHSIGRSVIPEDLQVQCFFFQPAQCVLNSRILQVSVKINEKLVLPVAPLDRPGLNARHV